MVAIDLIVCSSGRHDSRQLRPPGRQSLQDWSTGHTQRRDCRHTHTGNRRESTLCRIVVRPHVHGLDQLSRTGHTGDQRFEAIGNGFLGLRFLRRCRTSIGPGRGRRQNGLIRHEHATTLEHRQPHEVLLAELLSLADKALSLASSIPGRHLACLLHLLEELRELVRLLNFAIDVDLRFLSSASPPTGCHCSRCDHRRSWRRCISRSTSRRRGDLIRGRQDRSSTRRGCRRGRHDEAARQKCTRTTEKRELYNCPCVRHRDTAVMEDTN